MKEKTMKPDVCVQTFDRWFMSLGVPLTHRAPGVLEKVDCTMCGFSSLKSKTGVLSFSPRLVGARDEAVAHFHFEQHNQSGALLMAVAVFHMKTACGLICIDLGVVSSPRVLKVLFFLANVRVDSLAAAEAAHGDLAEEETSA